MLLRNVLAEPADPVKVLQHLDLKRQELDEGWSFGKVVGFSFQISLGREVIDAQEEISQDVRS